jgi:hypothetical protein
MEASKALPDNVPAALLFDRNKKKEKQYGYSF